MSLSLKDLPIEIYQGAVGMLIFAWGWWVKTLWGRQDKLDVKIEKLNKEFQEHRVHVEKQHPTKPEMETQFDRVNNKLDMLIERQLKD